MSVHISQHVNLKRKFLLIKLKPEKCFSAEKRRNETREQYKRTGTSKTIQNRCASENMNNKQLK